jgi:hypothetical protein
MDDTTTLKTGIILKTDIILKRVEIPNNRFIFAVKCFRCPLLASEFNENNEPVCPKHAKESAQVKGER